jgi:flagellar motor switch protein FliN/FliY
MNQMIGSSSTSMSEMLKRKVDISPPEAHYNRIDSLEDNNVDLNKDDDIVKVAFNMKIGDLIDSQIMQLMPIDVAKQLVSILIGSQEESKPVAQNAQPAPKQTQTSTQTKQNQPIEQPMQNNSPPPQRQVQQPVNTQPLQFDNFDSQPVYYGYNSDINLIRDVPLEISVELGKTSKRISEILDFGPGSVIELDKLVGEPLDILANGKLIAKGEVVVVDENYGVRITDIIMPDERIKKL